MPQDHMLINKEMSRILRDESELTQNTPDENKKEVHKNALLKKMSEKVFQLAKKNQISQDHAENALEAIKFYTENVQLLDFQQNPVQILSELSAIDYSKKVEIVTIRPGRILTQMQRPYAHNTVGSFYAEGVLPSEFSKRANLSGIGLNSQDQETSLETKKSVYISKTTKTSTFLKSSAAAALDTWSTPHNHQRTDGGGKQWRVATKDFTKVQRLSFGELDISHAGAKDKPLEKGVNAVPLKKTTKVNKPESTPITKSNSNKHSRPRTK